MRRLAEPSADQERPIFSAAAFEQRARAALSLDASLAAADPGDQQGGDHRLDGSPMFSGSPRAAAVLVPVVMHDAEVTVLLTTRHANLRQHSGQIAFPGGKIDPDDASPLAAALREAEEEIGLGRESVTPLGYLDPYLTGTGYRVLPVVGLVVPPLRLTINPLEVDDAFEVPLGFLMDPSNHELHSREFAGRLRRFYAMPFGGPVHLGGNGRDVAQSLREALRLMLRGLIEVGLPFLLPFAGYVLFLTLKSRYPFVAAAWTRGPVAVLVVSGLALAVPGRCSSPAFSVPARTAATGRRISKTGY